jgi:CheY-like chemotaxis protein
MPAKGTPTTILVVDDELDMRTLVRVVIDLADHGLTVAGEAADGNEAIAAWEALDGPPEPDVIVLDNRMPGQTGLEVAAEILRQRPDQLIVLFSAFLDDEVRAKASEIGIAACVSKDDVQALPEIIWNLDAVA